MTNEELQAKLAETEKQLAISNRIIEKMTEGDIMAVSILYPYKCKSCSLYHLPEPIKGCVREQDR